METDQLANHQSTTEQQQHKPSTGRSGWRTFGLVVWLTFKWLFIFGLMAGLAAGGAVTGYVASLVQDEPVRPRMLMEDMINEDAITGFVYFNDGQPVGQLRTEEDRRLIQLNEIPVMITDAVLAIEDNNFRQHIGVDINGLGRAVKQKLLNEDIQTGGSTLTQQLARRVFLNLDVTDSRKVKEIFLSLRLERYLSKDEILTAYLNKVPFGNGSSGYNLYGIKAAAKGIFDIDDLEDVNLAQAAYLAGLPQRPSAYTAFTGRGEFNEQGFNFAMDRQKLVLRRMLETGRITNQQYEQALRFDIRASLAEPDEKAYSTYPYLMLEAERQAAEILLMQEDPSLTLSDVRDRANAMRVEEARLKLLRGGYHIHTTIDKDIYHVMRDIASNPDNFSPDHPEKGMEQTAAMMIDHRTGAILGMIEGRDFFHEQMNYATQMVRQPGSAMKTIAAYLPAVDAGYIQPGGIVDDAPVVLKDGQKGFHIPRNWNNSYRGLVTAREALNDSLNMPALKLFLEEVTIEKAWEFARSLGISTLQPSDEYAQTGVMGGLAMGVSVEELTNAYGAIPNQGLLNDAYLIARITDSNGKSIYEYKANPKRVFSEQTAFLVTDMLRTVVANGTGSRLRSEFDKYNQIPIAGKTGTTQSYGDVWFLGFTPDVTLGVWSGYEQQIHTLSTDGRARARKVWAQIMNEVTEIKPELFATEQFVQPAGIVKATVSSVSGKRPTELTRQAGKLVTDWFNEAYLPKEDDDALVRMSYISYNGINFIAKPSTPEDFISEQTVIRRKKPLDVLFEEIEAAQAQLPESSRRPLSYYLPADAGNDAPSREDPRVDDGADPSPPANVRANLADLTDALIISFQENTEADIVGYRLYRSLNEGPFVKTGNSIVKGEETRFVNYISLRQSYAYYVTAVDVAGRESAPSLIVTYAGGNTGDNEPPSDGETPANEDGNQPGGANDGDNDNTGTGNSNGSTGNLGNTGNTGGTGANNNGNSNDSSTDAGGGSGSGAGAGSGGVGGGNGGGNGDGATQAAPAPPSSLRATGTETGISLTWAANPVSDQVTQYHVYYSETSNGRFSRLGSTADTRFDYPATEGFFRISAVNARGESGLSNAISTD